MKLNVVAGYIYTACSLTFCIKLLHTTVIRTYKNMQSMCMNASHTYMLSNNSHVTIPTLVEKTRS